MMLYIKTKPRRGSVSVLRYFASVGWVFGCFYCAGVDGFYRTLYPSPPRPLSPHFSIILLYGLYLSQIVVYPSLPKYAPSRLHIISPSSVSTEDKQVIQHLGSIFRLFFGGFNLVMVLLL